MSASKNCAAPIVIWSDVSPDSVRRYPDLETKQVARPPSNGSSGIGADIEKSSIGSCDSDYSPTISSIANEPVLLSYNNSANCLDDNENVLSKCSSLNVLDNPVSEGVKFVGISDRDSIYSSDSFGDDDEDDDNDSEPKIPDGGWGWVVVGASLVLSMIMDGISFSFGLLYTEFLLYFGESKSKTSLVGSLFLAVPLLSGPVMSALVDKYGCRKMTILGGIISASGFVLATMSNSIEMLLLTFGIIAGLGLGMCYVTAIVSIAYWFDKKRTLAVGLGSCGTGIGTFIYAPMTQYLIETFGWRGAVLLLAGTFLNMCVCGAVMRDPDWWIQEQKKQRYASTKSIRGSSCGGSVSRLSGVDSNFPGVEEIRELMKSGETPEYILTTLATSIADAQKLESATEAAEKPKHVYTSVVNLPTFIKESEKVPLEVLESICANKKLYNVILENYPSLLSCRSCSDNKLNKLSDKTVNRVPVTMSVKLKASKKTPKLIDSIQQSIESAEDTTKSPLLTNSIVTKPSILKNPTMKSPPKAQDTWLKRQFSTNQHYLRDIRMHRNSVMYRGAMMNIAKYRLRASSCPNIYRNSMININKEEEEKWYDQIVETLKGMFYFKMFLEFHFLLLSLSTILLFVWFIVPYFYLAEFMKRNGYDEDDATQLYSIIGITNTIGMVALGWAGDRPWLNVPKCFAVCLVVCGISSMMYPLVTHSYPLLILVSVFFGLSFASSYSFTPAILVELLPLDKFTIAYGLTLLCQGIGNLLGPPIAGFIFDITGSWDLSFYMSGVGIVSSGILVGLIPYTKNFRIWGSAPLEKDLERVSQKDSISIA